jgi:hypothetical protein
MAHTWSTVRSEVRLIIQDTDPVSPAISDAQLLTLANTRYMLWVLKYERTLIGTVNGTAVIIPTSGAIQSQSIGANILEVTGAALGSTTGKILPVNVFFKVSERAANEVGIIDEVGILVSERDDSQTNLKITAAPTPLVATSVYINYIAYPSVIANDTDQFKVNHGHQRILTRLIAADAAALVGRDDAFVAKIIDPIKDALPNGFTDWTVPTNSPSSPGGGDFGDGGGGDVGGRLP